MSCKVRFAFGCWLFGSLFEDVGGLLHPAALLALWPATASPSAFQKPSAPSAIGEFGRDDQASVLQIEQKLASILRAFARAVSEAEQLLPALRRRADDHQDALLGVFEAGLQVNAVGPHVDVALGRQIALLPVLVLFDPDLLQPGDR